MPKMFKPTATPSWFNPKDMPSMEKRVATIKVKAAALFNNKKVVDTVVNLFSRWLDEKEYEDFADYEKVMKSVVEKHDVQFVKGTKRPFGFECIVDEVHYLLTLKANGDYQWSRLPFKTAR